MSAPTGAAVPLVDDYQWSGWFDKTATNHVASASELPGSALTGPIQGDWISFGETPSVITNGVVANGALVAGRVSFTYNEKINIASNVNLSSIKIRGTGGFDNYALFLVKPDTTPSGATDWVRTSGAGMTNDAAATAISLDGDSEGLGFYYGDNTIGFAVQNFASANTVPSNVTGVIADFEISADCLPEPAPQPTTILACPAGSQAGDEVRVGPFTTNARDWKWTHRTDASNTLENVEQPLFDTYRYRSYFNPDTLAEPSNARWISPGTTDPASSDIPGVPYPEAIGQSRAGYNAAVFMLNQPINVGANVQLDSIKFSGRFGFDDTGDSVFVQPAGQAGTYTSYGLLPDGYGSFMTYTTAAIPGFARGQNQIGLMLDGGQAKNSCAGGTCAMAAIADFYVTAACTGEPPSADLSITNTSSASSVAPGATVTYTVTASNSGPVQATGATVTNTLPASLTDVSWTCVGAGGGTCSASGSGAINDTVTLPAGASVTYTVTAKVPANATGSLASTASIAAPAGVDDPTPANNSATANSIVAVPGSATPVPALDLVGLALLGSLSAGIGAFALRRRQRAQ